MIVHADFAAAPAAVLVVLSNCSEIKQLDISAFS